MVTKQQKTSDDIIFVDTTAGQVGFSQSIASASTLKALALALQSEDLELRRTACWALWKLDLVTEDHLLPQRAAEVEEWDGNIWDVMIVMRKCLTVVLWV